MSPIKRIVINTCATYGRTLFRMALGLFSARWILNGLGKEDYGLFGVVGGIIVFISLLNGLLASSVGRYYAYVIGEAKLEGENKSNDDLCRWFNTALLIHTILPILLILVGYPIGVFAIENWLNIPYNRIPASIWVFRISLFSSFINMVSVPYIAMYQARQLIAELSLWGMITTITNFIIAYYILYCSYDRFITYSFLSALAPALVLAIQIYRARKHFTSCRVKINYLFDRVRFIKIFNFAFWDFFGWLGASIRDQGAIFVINRNFNSGVIAAYRLAQSVITYTTSLSTAITSSMQPAITTAVGQKNIRFASTLASQTSKFGAAMILLFALPLAIEMETVLKLWLINPPEFTVGFCRSVLLATVILKLGWGHHIAVCANGKIAMFQFVLGVTAIMSLGILLLFIRIGFGPLSVGYSLIVTFVIMTIERVVFAKKLVNMSIRYWIIKICVPIVLVTLLSGVFGFCFSCLLQPSFFRIIGTSVLTVSVFSILLWFIVLNSEERVFIKKRFSTFIKKSS